MLNKNTLLLFFILATLKVLTQENSFFYQGSYFDPENKPFKNVDIKVKISIVKDSMNGAGVFSEIHSATTNESGLFTLMVGTGLNLFGQLDQIDWSGSIFYISTRINLSSDPNFTKTIASKVSSVPYAFYVKNADSLVHLDEHDSAFVLSPVYAITQNDLDRWNIDYSNTNELQYLSVVQDTIYISKGNSIAVKLVLNDYGLVTNPPILATSISQLVNNLNSFHFSSEDENPANEIQNLGISSDTISISKGNFIILNQTQALFFNNYSGLMNKPLIPDALSELINDASYLSATEAGDFDPSNEIQALSIDTNAKLSLTKSNYVNLPIETADNQSFSVSESGDTLFLSNSNFVIIPGISRANTIPFNSQLVYGSVNDIEGNTYRTIVIGQKEWMAENLRSTIFSNGEPIPITFDNLLWGTTSSPAYTFVNNDVKNKESGNLYNWHAVTDTRNVCPIGWHVPSDEEWTNLSDFLGGLNIAGNKLKSANLAFWESLNPNTDNSSGFSGLPMGLRNVDGQFANFRINGYWWSATEVFGYTGYSRFLNYNDQGVMRTNINKNIGCSVRCIRN